ncbi:MAG: hypothetical protein ACYC63_01230 [Armatimonadota bacterium]
MLHHPALPDMKIMDSVEELEGYMAGLGTDLAARAFMVPSIEGLNITWSSATAFWSSENGLHLRKDWIMIPGHTEGTVPGFALSPELAAGAASTGPDWWPKD